MPTSVALQAALDKSGLGAARPRTETLGRYKVDSAVAGALRNAAQATGMDFEVLAAKAAMESGFRADAQASTSSARGLFQFIDQTWLGVVQAHGAEHGLAEEAAAITRQGSRLTVSDPALRSRILALRENPEIAARLGAEHLKDLGDALASAIGHRPDATELYLGHFLGLRGAGELLQKAASDPQMAASQVLPDAARANPAIFRGGDGAPLSVRQVIDKLRERVNSTYAQLGLEAPSGPVTIDPSASAQAAKSGAAVASNEPFWWGSGAPARVAHAPEQSMLSTLMEVFTRMNKAGAQRAAGEDPRSLPADVVAALHQGSDAAAEARKAYGAG
ncbi:lytic transglycosylase domain-containing protein [Roseomonas sp. M0104]|uniref:Lytic transglycosylase domain-containing protein n=1 Tax=Teichococcus coralli TaxID=2545983 RepID=A0A845BHN8_9PROT|nr:hypothetical protein [Pseudoroseomonas coralli]MXP65600.1 lytic transglycosylase domain-containing protein [Pseudoroseomonas coralli]